MEFLELARPIRLSEKMFPAILGGAPNIPDRLTDQISIMAWFWGFKIRIERAIHRVD